MAMAAVVAVAAALAPGATLLRAIRGLAPNVFAPFPKDVWLRTPVERELVYGCLHWPRPRIGPHGRSPAAAPGRACRCWC